MELATLKITDFEPGKSLTHTWQVQEKEIDLFAELSGDFNPLHMDGEFAKKAGFEGRVSHGFLLGTKLTGIIGMKFPGENGVLLEQNLGFAKPIYAGDEITFNISVKEVWQELSVVEFKVKATRPNGEKKETVARGSYRCKIHS